MPLTDPFLTITIRKKIVNGINDFLFQFYIKYLLKIIQMLIVYLYVY